jgi:hypothetical protein
MKHPHDHTPQNSSSTHSKVPVGVASKSSSLTHPWWIYQANQMKVRNTHRAELLAQIDFADEPPTGWEDGR